MNTPMNAQLAATANTVDGASVTITNELSVIIVIYDQFDPSNETNANLPLTYTLLGQVLPGKTTVVTAPRAVSQLVATINGTLEEFGGKDYYANFPVKLMSGTTMAANPAPLAYSVTAADRAAMVLAWKFQKFTMANPDSVLSKGFLAAAARGFAAVNTFFAGTQKFQACTMATWNATFQWQYNFTSPWQGPYYLYAVPAAGAPAGAGPTLVATLNLTSTAAAQKATLSMCSADSQNNPLYGHPRQDFELAFVNRGVLGTSAEEATVSASLTPVWMNVVMPASDASGPEYLIGKAFTGTVAGIKVVSSQTARQQPDKPATKSPAEAGFWDKFQKYGGESIGALAGLVVLYDFISNQMKKWAEAKEAARQQQTEAEQRAADQAAEAQADAALAAPEAGVAAQQAELAPQVQAAENALADQVDVAQQAAAREALDAVDASVAAVEAEVQAAIENGEPVNQAMNDAVINVEAQAAGARKAIDAGQPVGEPLSQVGEAVDGLRSDVASAGAEVMASAENAAASVQEAAARNQALDNAQAERAAAQQDPEADGGANPEDNDEAAEDPIEVVE